MLRLFSRPRWHADTPALGFVPEWLTVAVLMPIAVVLVIQAGIHFRITPHDSAFLVLVPLAAGIVTRKLGWMRGGMVLEFTALLLATGLVLAVLTYAASARSGPWMDAPLRAFDEALGFDWLSWFRFVTGHPLLGPILEKLYFSLGIQVFYFVVLMALMGNVERMREIFWLLLIGCLLTCVGAWAAPALGPFDTYGLKQTYGQFVLELEHLKSGQDMNFALGRLQGVVGFPSFHTTMALGIAYGMRKTGIIGWIILGADLLLLLAVPVYGGHYLADMVAGFGVFVVALATVRYAPKLRDRMISRSARRKNWQPNRSEPVLRPAPEI